MVLGLLATACGLPLNERSSLVAEPASWHHDTDPPAPMGLVSGRVRSVTDGDTLTVEVNGSTETVRLLGIDTPESPGGPRPAECFGTEAGLFLERLLPTGSEVWLSRDVESRDQYGRLLAWIHRPDGVFVNLALVESGHATTLFFAPNDALETRFEQSAWQARREQRGFWTACGGADVVLGVVPFGS